MLVVTSAEHVQVMLHSYAEEDKEVLVAMELSNIAPYLGHGSSHSGIWSDCPVLV